MTTDPFTEAANAAAREYARTPRMNVGTVQDRIGEAHADGWEAARAHLTAQEPTDAEQAARFAVESKHHLHGTQCLCGFESHRARSRTEHIMTHYFDELSAARAAEYEEEK